MPFFLFMGRNLFNGLINGKWTLSGEKDFLLKDTRHTGNGQKIKDLTFYTAENG